LEKNIKMKRILVPCNFSTPAEEAFKFAVRIARQSDGEVHVLYILDITYVRGAPALANSYTFNVNFIKEMEDEADEKFRNMRQKYAPLTLPVKFKQRMGTLIQDVENYVIEEHIDLIVMGTHGTNRASWGSNTEKIVRTATVPVMAVRNAEEKEIKNIVCPLIPDRQHKDFAAKIKNLQEFFGGEIHLLWVNTQQNFKSDREARTAFEDYARDFGLQHYSINIRSDYSVEEGIIHFATETEADLIAMGTHARKGINHLVLGSIAEDTLNHANFPMWTYTLK
jgi:nucleotide-binding universal stress UspA family protein